jgi:hypothetical protein
MSGAGSSSSRRSGVGVRRLRVLVSGFVLPCVLACGGGDRPASPSLLVAARDSVSREAAGLADDVRAVAWLDSLIREAGGDRNAGAELALLRLRAIERVLEQPTVRNYNPYSNDVSHVQPPAEVKTFVDAHGKEIVYSEPAGEWLVPSAVYWSLHDRYRQTRFTDELAWAAASAGTPGECEGLASCYLDVMLETYARYIDEHADGAYVAEAAQHIMPVLSDTWGADPGRPLCGDEQTSSGVRPQQLERMRVILSKAANRLPASDSTLRVLQRLEARCSSRS